MDFLRVFDEVCRSFDESGVRYALIGGFGMAMRGVQRATVDLDFILLSADLERADALLRKHAYERVFHSENVSHYRGRDSAFGRIDILHAFRGPTLSMLDRAERLEVSPGVTVPVARAEDIIGLKIQALVNAPNRADQDWSDIKALIQSASHRGEELDWELIADYLDIFELGDRLHGLREWYDKAE